jgi:hypothetical protein
MKPVLIVGAVSLALITGASAETRALAQFNGVTAADRIAVQIEIGARQSVRVEGPDARKVQTRVEGGDLRIRRANRPWFGDTPRTNATVYITMPAVESIAASRGATVRANDIAARNLEVAAAMGGSVEIAGTCRAIDASASMGGSVEAQNLRCETADASASMGGSVAVFAARSMDASASMGGSVSNAGGASAGDSSAVMGGSIAR